MSGFSIEMVRGQPWLKYDGQTLRVATDIEVFFFEQVQRLREQLKGCDDLARTAMAQESKANYRYEGLLATHRRVVDRLAEAEARLAVLKDKPLLDRLVNLGLEAQAAGYAITWWAPHEVGEADPDTLLDRAIAAGNDYLNEEKAP